MGIAPFWGWQMGIALLLAMFFKLNKVITLVASNISIPPMIPVIVYLSYLFGGYVYKYDIVNDTWITSPSLDLIYGLLWLVFTVLTQTILEGFCSRCSSTIIQ